MTSFNWKIAGFAGQGIKIAGLIMSKTALRSGLYPHGYTEYPSLIRGGHNTFQILASIKPVSAPQKAIDVMMALNHNGILNHLSEFTDKTLIITDLNLVKSQISQFKRQNQLIDIPLAKLAKDTGGGHLVRNIVALGASCFFSKSSSRYP